MNNRKNEYRSASTTTTSAKSRGIMKHFTKAFHSETWSLSRSLSAPVTQPPPQIPENETVHEDKNVSIPVKSTENKIMRFQTDDKNVSSGVNGKSNKIYRMPRRRESFLYKSDSEFEVSPRMSRMHSMNSFATGTNNLNEECFVTPFAQILFSLKQIRNNICSIEETMPHNSKEETPDKTKDLCRESIDEIDWCLQQLEGINPSKSVSALASSKFIKLMNRELRQAATTKGGEQVQRFIQNTFMEYKFNKKIKVHSSVPQVQQISIDFSEDYKNNPFGIKSDFPDELDQFMASLDTWGIDTFQANHLTNGRPLAAITFTIFKKRQLIEKFCMSPTVLLKYLARIEASYQSANSYHNSLHAADVTQSVHVLLNCKKLMNVFSDLEVLSLVFGAAIHDVNHPGVTNLYLINTNNQLALLYNDISVLENHHLAVAFEIMREDGCNIFENVDAKDVKTVRKLTIDLVLSTDMSKHMKLLADLKTVVESHKICKNDMHLESHNDRIEIMKNIIHLADLSNPAKPWPVYVKWVECITNEFFNQGDKERENGLEISPMCDRTNPSIEKHQVSFIDFIVHPLYETWSEFVEPEGMDMINILVDNRDRYVRLAEQKKVPADDVGVIGSSSSYEDDD